MPKPQRPNRLSLRLFTGGAVLLALLMGADALGLFRRLPPPRVLVRRMERALEALPGYQASLMVFGGTGSPGETCTQWRNEQGEVVTHVKTMLGYQYVQRWHGEVWEFYHPGLQLQGRVTVRNASRLACPQWVITGYPSLPELVAAVRTSTNQVVEGVMHEPSGDVWSLRCRPTFGKGVRLAGAPALLEDEWRVILPRSNDLPRQIVPATLKNYTMSGVSISSIKAATPSTKADWRALAGPVQVRRTTRLACDAAVAGDVEAATAPLRAEFDAYMRTQFPTASQRRAQAPPSRPEK